MHRASFNEMHHEYRPISNEYKISSFGWESWDVRKTPKQHFFSRLCNILEIDPIPSVFNAETADYSQSILIKRYRCYPTEYLK